ncbi:hypothetical protein [Clostridium perfringens]|uniref:hypothetical protein n=1 Tax=Clostridium perfringens TaxID=1502 RepID=UPI001C85ED5B|nr:hypothetical protein [Clostridium perfringens]
MKKVLMIAYHFPPEEGSCSDKNIKILKALVDSGLEVDVLTVGNYNSDEKFYNCSVIRVKGGIFHKSINCVKNESIDKKRNYNSIKNKLKKLIQKNIIPDSIIDWYPNVIMWAKKNRFEIENYGVILSISSPYSVHLISKKLSDIYKVPFICSYGDPWIYESSRYRGKIRYKIEYFLEKGVIRKARKIFVITEYNRQKYMQLYDIDSRNIDTFNIGFDANNIKKKNQNTEGELKFIYGGSLNPVHRNVEPFIKAIKGKDNIIVKIYNEDFHEVHSMVEKYQVNNIVKIRKLIPSNMFNEELYKSNVLLLFGNKTIYQVPGKLFEFMSTGTHILYIKNNNDENDNTEKILKEYGNVTIVENNEKSISNGIKEIISKKDRLNIKCNKYKFEYHITMASIVKGVKTVLQDKSKETKI